MTPKSTQPDPADLVSLVSTKKQKPTTKTLRTKAQAMWGEMQKGSGATDSDGQKFLGYDPY